MPFVLGADNRHLESRLQLCGYSGPSRQLCRNCQNLIESMNLHMVDGRLFGKTYSNGEPYTVDIETIRKAVWDYIRLQSTLL